jgi:sec-independent protein translocase protein TatA
MFNLGVPEVVLILVIVVLIFGASRLPELRGGMGNGIRNFRESLREDPQDEKRKM